MQTGAGRERGGGSPVGAEVARARQGERGACARRMAIGLPAIIGAVVLLPSQASESDRPVATCCSHVSDH